MAGGGVVKVYGAAASPYVATVLVCLEEAGAAYEFVPLDMAAREQKAPHHLARNVRTSLDRAPIRPSRSNSNSSSLTPVLMILSSLCAASAVRQDPRHGGWRTHPLWYASQASGMPSSPNDSHSSNLSDDNNGRI